MRPGPPALQGLPEPLSNERTDYACQALPSSVGAVGERRFYFMPVLTEDSESLIRSPRVRELNGRVRVLKPGIVPMRPCGLLYCRNKHVNPWLKIPSQMRAVDQRGTSGDHGLGSIGPNPSPPYRELSGIKDLEGKQHIWSAFYPAT